MRTDVEAETTADGSACAAQAVADVVGPHWVQEAWVHRFTQKHVFSLLPMSVVLFFFWGRRVSQQVTGKDATVAKKAGPEEGWNEGL